jgi:PAS domain-containing protein
MNNSRQRPQARRRMADALSPGLPPQVFQHTVNQADMAISITDAHGNILYVNPAFTRVTGYDNRRGDRQEPVDPVQQEHAARGVPVAVATDFAGRAMGPVG